MLKIGTFSKLSRISIRMLRHYDEIGLLRPTETDPETGYRYYRASQLREAGRIQALRDMGFGLASIAVLLEIRDPAELERAFRQRSVELKAEINEAAYRLRLLDTAAQRLRKDGKTMDMNVTVKTIPARKAACLRMTLPSYDAEGMAWDILMRETAEQNLIPDDPCLCCVAFYDDEYKEADVDVEVQKTVKGDYRDTEHVRFCELPPVKVASAVYNGSYAGLDEAMRGVAEWVSGNGYSIPAPIFCIYHVSPHETEDETKFVTEICYPINT